MPRPELVRPGSNTTNLNRHYLAIENGPMGLMPTCREIHQLVSEGMDRKLTRSERMRMRVHLFVCDACTRFDAQMLLLRSAMRRLGQDHEPGAD
jgi:hypothetical protein